MQNEILFSESQRFKQWWLWALMLSLNGLFITGLIMQIGFGKAFGNKPMNDTGLIISACIVFVITLSMLFMKLDTRIDKDGISVRYFPFFLTKFYPWNTIVSAYAREYKPISEYGGWGLRGFGKNKAYNVSGNKGLQLEFIDGKNC